MTLPSFGVVCGRNWRSSEAIEALDHGSPAIPSNQALFPSPRLARHTEVKAAVCLLPPQVTRRKTLVLDLDETMIHSVFDPVPCDFEIAIDWSSMPGEPPCQHKAYVKKRPGVDMFLKRLAAVYEIVIWTASVPVYGDPLIDVLDPDRVVHHRLFRNACVKMSGGYAKDLSRLGRDLSQVMILDNSPVCYSLQPENAIAITTWHDDEDDKELLDLVPVLLSILEMGDLRDFLQEAVEIQLRSDTMAE